MSERRSGWWKIPAQVLASAVVLYVLVRQADPMAVLAALSEASVAWVLIAAAVKALGLALHELRLWVMLQAWRKTPIMPVLSIGFLSGLLNSVLPIRGGDLVAMGLLRKELDVSTPAAVAAVGITGFVEAAVFGVFVLGVMVLGASEWEQLVGVAETAAAQNWLTLAVFGATIGAVGLGVLGRKLRSDAPTESRPGVVQLVRDTVVQTGTGLTSWGPIAANVGLAAVQVLLVVGSFWAILPALGLHVEFPLLAVCGVVALGSIAAVVLPPSLGAGAAATSVFVLGAFGVSEADALAFTAISWIANSVPPFILGIGPLTKRIGRIGELVRG
ncbi:MAG: flippase-like domain-containing protein [Proteobacteria bacterium]|nr:flippase-like domain-containing protein [Pseudomonadota bacterium]